MPEGGGAIKRPKTITSIRTNQSETNRNRRRANNPTRGTKKKNPDRDPVTGKRLTRTGDVGGGTARTNIPGTITPSGPSGLGGAPSGGLTTGTTGTTGTSFPAGPIGEFDTLTPNSAFGRQFAESSLQDLMASPGVLSDIWLSGQGIDSQQSGGTARVLQDLADVAPDLFRLVQAYGLESGVGPAAFTDFMDQFLTQMTTPGGGTPKLGSSIFGAGQDPNSTLYNILNNPSQDTGGQINTLRSLLGSASSLTLDPVMQQVMDALVADQGNKFMAAKATNPLSAGTFGDWVSNQSTIDDFYRG